jgi:hypothetical protein
MPIQLSLPAEGSLKQRISQMMPLQNQSLAQETRRTSSRSIKRKKFDDEVVESSLIKTERGRVTKLPTITQVLEKIEPVEKELPPAPPPEKKKVNDGLFYNIHLSSYVADKQEAQGPHRSPESYM